MQLAYPAALEVRPDTVLVSFPDIPEALTEGDTKADALSEAVDCLVAALGGYVHQRRRIPAPSHAQDAPMVKLPALVAAKLALYEAMWERNATEDGLAEQLGATRDAVQRLLDLDHRSPIGQVERALQALGMGLAVEAYAT